MYDLLHRKLSRVTEPQVLFPLLTLVLLTIIWGTTWEMLRLQRVAVEHNAATQSRELIETYEAQVVRALREIDHTLNLVKSWPERRGGRHVLEPLKEQGLLPPDLIFIVSIADREGNLIESTRTAAGGNVAREDYFVAQRDQDSDLFVNRLPAGPTAEQQLHFSRRLTTAEGAFDGIAIVSVEANYFVSGYEPGKLGEHGVLGLLGLDGVFRVRRTGETVASGEQINYTALVQGSDAESTIAEVSRSSWDGTSRWISARELYGFPLAVLVGLSVPERLATLRPRTRSYILGSAIASVAVIGLAALLARMSWRLARVQQRESEARVAHARQVEFLAYHDGLTGLPNRSLFSRLLGQHISEARHYDEWLAVAFLDLDRFKQINDTLGHEAGDQLLCEVATRLKSCVRGSDTVARLGGDEFVVLLHRITAEVDAGLVAQKILAAVAQPFALIGQEFRVTASVGVTVYPRDGLDEQTLTKNADIAMYQAKSEGKNNFQFYSAQLNTNSLERLTLESALRHALERDEFRLHYQAKRDIATGRITGMEALLRWENPDLGTVAPMRFIPVAEETGLILPIGKWVLKAACAQGVAWQRQGLPPLSIAVNLTARQFRDEQLLPDITSILAASGMDSRLLEVEIHESLLMHNVDSTLRTLTRLRALGVRIAIDDFGTGYSSLAMLHRFPLDTIKIDRSITREFVGNTANTALAANIIAMGKSLSLTVVAQGVETREQADLLRAQACDELQGFYFKRPLPPDEFAALLREQCNESHGAPRAAAAPAGATAS